MPTQIQCSHSGMWEPGNEARTFIPGSGTSYVQWPGPGPIPSLLAAVEHNTQNTVRSCRPNFHISGQGTSTEQFVTVNE